MCSDQMRAEGDGAALADSPRAGPPRQLPTRLTALTALCEWRPSCPAMTYMYVNYYVVTVVRALRTSASAVEERRNRLRT